MDYITATTEFNLKNTAVCLGKFDGLHKGHMKLIEIVLQKKEKGYNCGMFTFDYHPSNLFSEKETQLIYTEEEKRYKLKDVGLDVLIAYPFTKETANMLPEDFIKEILVGKLDAKIIVVGNDFCFGKERKGNISTLKEHSNRFNYKLIVCDKVTNSDSAIGSAIGSTTIRNEITLGNIELVNEMLGRPFSIMGKIIHGRKIGRTLGMPTINLIPKPCKLLPPNGVYITETIIDNEYYKGITNIGYKPTVNPLEGEKPFISIETYLFDLDEDLYGKEIEVLFYNFIRKEQKFNSIDELKMQMQSDIKNVKGYF